MKTVKNALYLPKYHVVTHESQEDMSFVAPHLFHVAMSQAPHSVLGEVHFQEGPIKEAGVNGVHNEDLIAMVICRLEHFQKSEFHCQENELALNKLQEALMWLCKRTIDRELRGVEGTRTV